MNKKTIEEEYNKKIKLYNEYNRYYYNNSSPKVSDKEFDKLKADILSFEKKYKIKKKNKIKRKSTIKKIKSLFDRNE